MLASSAVRAQIGLVIRRAIASQACQALTPIFNLSILGAVPLPSTLAQTITPDGSLPTVVRQNEVLNQFIVTGGSAQGSNLFHSFETFSPAARSVLFDLRGESFGNEIERIFSRVTGDEISEINGLLGLLGGNSPDLFLLNPNGIVFGPDARLSLAGSFIGTTANSIQFSDGSRFSTLLTQTESTLLSISVPVGLQLGQNPGEISVLGPGRNILRPTPFAPPLQDPAFSVQGLSVTPGNTLALIGGDLRFQGGEIQPLYVPTPDGQTVPLGGIQLELGAVANGSVKLEPSPFGWKADYADVQTYRNISLSENAWLNAGGLLPSNVSLGGQNITFSSSSLLNFNLGEQAGGNVDLYATGTLQLQGNGSELTDISEIQVASLGSGQAGDLKVVAENMRLLDGTYVANSSYGVGDAGTLTIDVAQDLQLNGFSGIAPASAQLTFISATTLSSGSGGDLDIQAKNISIENGGVISAASLTDGLGGSLIIKAKDSLTLSGTNPLSIADSNISTANFGTTDANGVTSITAPRLEVLNGASISADSYGTGDASGVEIHAAESVRVGGLDDVPRSQPGQITSGARQSTFSSFDGEIGANEGGLNQETLTGNGGNIIINTPSLQLFDGGQVSTTNTGIGDAGSIQIQTGTLTLFDQSEIAAETEAGAGGNIRLLAANSILLRNGSQISASSGGEKNGGNIWIQTPQLIAIPQENSDISANSKGAQGGGITITASSVLGLKEQPQLTDQSDITALSAPGSQLSGTIELTQPNTSPVSGLRVLPSSLLNEEQAPITNACTGADTQLSRSGRGGLPLGPNNLLHDTLFVDGDNDPINQAIALRSQGFYTKALTILSKEVARFNSEVKTNSNIKNTVKTADRERQATALRQLGITYKLLEQHKESREILEKSLAISQHFNLPEQNSATLLSLGNLTRAKDKIEEARAYYQQALDENPGPILKNQILANQLSLEVTLSGSKAAQDLAKKVLKELSEDIRDPLHLETRLNVAATLLKNEELDITPNFLTFLEQDLAGAKRIQNPKAIAYALGHLSKAYEQTGEWQNAQTFAEAALNQAQKQQDRFLEYRWAWQLGRVTRARWEVSGDEQWRSQAKAAYKISLQALQQLRGDLATISPALQFSFRTRVEPVYREYVSLLITPQADASLTTQDTSQAVSGSTDSLALKEAVETIEALKLVELDNFFQDACLTATAQSIKTLDADAAVLYPIILEDRVELIISYGGELHQHTLPVSAQELKQTIQTFRRNLLIRSRTRYRGSSQKLYKWLIQPLYDELKASEIKTLVFVPDGPLKSIPLSALTDGEEFLIEQFNLAIAPSLQLLPAQSSLETQPRVLAAGITQEHQGFPGLPYVNKELEALKSRFSGEQLVNESFTHEALGRSLLYSQAPIVHIATHGQFSSQASDTFILAWDEPINIEQLQELLMQRDQNNVTPTELLVLSACETAVGEEFAALGLAGMAVRAGARSTLASLWNVNDESTALLMEAFYQQLSQSATTKSAALREAQLAMLKHPVYSHPYYWSAFTLMGNWQ